MSSLAFLIPLALVFGGAALAALFWSLRSSQYDDLDGAAERIFLDPDDDRADADTLGLPPGQVAQSAKAVSQPGEIWPAVQKGQDP
ncbi:MULTISPECIES: cbb3-type cytochrome oxidase assembly protein CcoS [unclassified Chelatococcus]|uniref:cbb3-type cytochrome oxidase assembly protein CcoS n=1 Tax=unclassified Chelatococcus TaxID=2638111 RepID=UPI001BCF189D|nr:MULTISPECIES: cbb3-type cytochrome oxidase assembly protein CcoS [unclassified Chelatococcus]CAH1651624.1 Cbb3-type cytochrome oxidase maturation protein [Hyphomicrobiales bacterium]MBS7743144.1 cbb3-type cytochrome oxidase assembly protein CcoS [Chelatococcus sp. HY11]MBX3541738.1 cbb3-type cytochrome oxidase assembly protein CcoS [Chelatococcus sp.]MCO5074370.1 cbb3-type cytochrome oxidase assembly protein CcoS [Chelatococcus sp.]CAH1693375.1 Cbb3-type cytochrome oxidase maturation protei